MQVSVLWRIPASVSVYATECQVRSERECASIHGMEQSVSWGAAETARRIRSGDITAAAALEARVERIERLNPLVNAIVDRDFERARREAAQADAVRRNGKPLGPLHGVALTMKSSLDVQGLRCECGSRFRQGRIADRDAPLVASLRKAGAIILAVTNTPDMLMAYETDNFLYGRTNNPFDLSRTAGGSSGGEAAAIAAGFSAGGMGSDGGGSVRAPASFCGIAGLKPTPGVIPRTGHWPACMGPGAFLGLVGPMAPRVEDLDLLLRASAGVDRHDPMSAPVEIQPMAAMDLAGVAVGYYEDDGVSPVDDAGVAAVRRAADALRDAGAAVERVELEGVAEAIEAWKILFRVAGLTLTKPLIAGRDHDVHPLSWDLFADEPDERSMTYEKFLGAWVQRDRSRSKLLGLMERWPLLLGPTASVPAFEHGRREWRIGDRVVRYPDIFTYTQLYNLTGNPAAVVRSGSSPEGLPIGVQCVARPFEDALALAAAEQIERRMGPWAPAETISLD